MNFILEKCRFAIYDESVHQKCAIFDCGNIDLNDFFVADAFLQSKQLLCKNYCFTLDSDPSIVVCAFTLCNDSIKKIPNARRKKIERSIPHEKQYSSYPAVMIGRLGVNKNYQSQHIGSEVLDFIKAWFIVPLNKTGCRFLLVDSYNEGRNISFYQKNGFQLLFGSEDQEKEFRNLGKDKLINTRLIYFDLIELV